MRKSLSSAAYLTSDVGISSRVSSSEAVCAGNVGILGTMVRTLSLRADESALSSWLDQQPAECNFSVHVTELILAWALS